METLQEIADGIGCTKFKDHSYAPVYESLFNGLRYSEIKILEIGVDAGESLLVWNSYFTKARITGADIKMTTEAANALTGKTRVQMIHLDQGSIHQLNELPGTYDIIIDDGSHCFEHQILTYGALKHRVSKYGFYVIEDIHDALLNRFTVLGGVSFRMQHLKPNLVDNNMWVKQ